MPLKINIHANARSTFAIVAEANPINGPDRESFGKLKPFVGSYTPYAVDAAPGSVEGIFRTIGAGAAAPAAASK